jgi:hypothetical protein
MFVRGFGRGKCSRKKSSGNTRIQPAWAGLEAFSELMRSIETPGRSTAVPDGMLA